MEKDNKVSLWQFVIPIVTFLVTVAVSYGALNTIVSSTKDEVKDLRIVVHDIEVNYVSRAELRQVIQELKQHLDSRFNDNQELIREKLARIEDKIDKNNNSIRNKYLSTKE